MLHTRNFLKPGVLFKIFIFLFLLTTAGQITADAVSIYQNAGGPLYTKNLYAPYLPFIDLAAESARCLLPGHFGIKGVQNYANTFRLDYGETGAHTVILIDTESYAFTLDLAYSLLPFLEIGMDCSLVTLGGGWLDPLIVIFHNALGFPNSGRNAYPYYGSGVIIGRWDGLWWNIHGPGWGIRNTTLRMKWVLFREKNDRCYIALQPALKIPLPGNNVLLSGRRCDLAVRLLIDFYFPGFALYLNGGWACLGTPRDFPGSLFSNRLFFCDICLEGILSKTCSLYAQLEANSSPYTILHRFLDSPVFYLSAGCRLGLFPGLYFQLSFTEELFFFAATDIAGSASFVFRM